MKQTLLNNEALAFLSKIIFPAFIGVGIKIAIEMRKNKTKTSLFNVALSMFVGVGGAYLSNDIVQEIFSYQYVSIVVAIIAILTDKIAEFLIYKFNVDVFLSALADTLLDTIKKSNK